MNPVLVDDYIFRIKTALIGKIFDELIFYLIKLSFFIFYLFIFMFYGRQKKLMIYLFKISQPK